MSTTTITARDSRPRPRKKGKKNPDKISLSCSIRIKDFHQVYKLECFCGFSEHFPRLCPFLGPLPLEKKEGGESQSSSESFGLEEAEQSKKGRKSPKCILQRTYNGYIPHALEGAFQSNPKRHFEYSHVVIISRGLLDTLIPLSRINHHFLLRIFSQAKPFCLTRRAFYRRDKIRTQRFQQNLIKLVCSRQCRIGCAPLVTLMEKNARINSLQRSLSQTLHPATPPGIKS